MATMMQDGFSITIEFTGLDPSWVYYYISLMHGDQPMLNPKIYRKHSGVDSSRLLGTGADDYGESLIPILEWGLKNNEAVSWSPVDPDVTVAMYPDDIFPLVLARPRLLEPEENETPFDYPGRQLSPKETMRWSSEEAEAEEAAYAIEKARRGGKHPNDPVCLIVKINTYVFSGGGYSPSGPALIFHASRREMEKFVRELKREFKALKKSQNTPENNRAFTSASPLAPEKGN